MNGRTSHQKVGLIMKYLKIGSGASPRVGDVRPLETRIRRRGGRAVVAGLLAAVLVMAPSLTFAEDDKAAEVSKESGLGAAAALSSLVYGPVKILYAVGGLVVGGCAWVFTAGDGQVAETVFTRSLRGDYVITPGILLGEEELVFIGRDSAGSAPPAESVASATPAYEDTDYDDLGW